jgi:phosphoribosylaminoimidazolecarboxamide formyltransferase/IMP cyclohydrolase
LSAFGGVVAFNRPVDGRAAEALAKPFLEVVVAPAFDDEALRVLSAKKNLRLVAWPTPRFSPFETRPAMGGWLVQAADPSGSGESWRTVTKRSAPASLEADLRFAWLVAKHARSNAIVVAKDGVTLGIGAGHVSRVDAVETALRKAPATALAGAAVASEAFFPFRDSIDRLAAKGIAAVVQPGGSVKDAEVIAACDEHGMAMAFTGRRHFRH